MEPYYSNFMGTLYHGKCLDVLRQLPDGLVNTGVTSPPYFGLRDYGVDGQIGLEPTPEEFVASLVEVFREFKRVLRDDGTLWVNLGDSYNAAGRSGHGTRIGFKQGTNRASDTGADNCRPSVATLKEKDLIGIPWRVAFALQADGWYLRQDIIWNKPNPMPESVTDRCTKAHEYIFLLSKSPRYYFDSVAMREPANRPEGAGNKSHKGKTAYEDGDEKMRTKVGLTEIGPREFRNKRSVWTVTPKPYKEAHFATYPPDLIEPCILAGCPPFGVVCDPFMGSGTTAEVAERNDRRWVGAELNSEYCDLIVKRLEGYNATV